MSGEPLGSDHRQIRFAFKYMENLEWDCNPKTINWKGYRTDLEAILKNAPTRFHSRENLEFAAQYINNAI